MILCEGVSVIVGVGVCLKCMCVYLGPFRRSFELLIRAKFTIGLAPFMIPYEIRLYGGVLYIARIYFQNKQGLTLAYVLPLMLR